MDNEIRSAGVEVRTEDEGVFEGYIVTWNSVDSYNSTFRRGAFKKTLEERAGKIKVLYNHDQSEVIGVPEEIREDETGVFVRGRLITSVRKAAETHELMKAGAINTLSFGFRAVKQRFEKGVRIITEVMLAEISPVVFEANAEAIITDVRSDDYNATLREREIYRKRYTVMDALYETMEDIWWGLDRDNLGEAAEKFEDATSAFAAAHREWFTDFADFFGVDEGRSINFAIGVDNPLASATLQYLHDKDIDASEFSQRSSLTVEEIQSLRAGKPIADYKKLDGLDDEGVISSAHRQVRSTAVEALCSELRAGVNPAETKRMIALMSNSLPKHDDGEAEEARGAEDICEYLDGFRSQLKNSTE